MGRTSKRKGSTYERKLAHMLSCWWASASFSTTFEKGAAAFGRSPSSGMWASSHGAQRGGSDILPLTDAVAAEWPFCVETKNRAGYSFENLLAGFRGDSSRDILAWWEQVEGDAARENRVPLLIWHKQSSAVDYVMFRWQDVAKLFEYTGGMRHLRYFELHYPDPRRDDGCAGFIICTLADWLGWLDPEAVKSWGRQRRGGANGKEDETEKGEAGAK